MGKRTGSRIHRPDGLNTWRAGCGESRTSGSEGGPEKPTSRKAGRALRPDPYTYIWTDEGFVYLAAIIDCCTRMVEGWSTADHLRTELCTAALQDAVAKHRPGPGLIHHSDRGCQYTSHDYRKALSDLGFVQSMSRKGNRWDNAVAESFFSTLKLEVPGEAHSASATHAPSP